MQWFKKVVLAFISPDKVGGWVRAAVAALLTMLVAKFALKLPIVAEIVTPDMVDAIAVAAGTAVAGIFSQIAKA